MAVSVAVVLPACAGGDEALPTTSAPLVTPTTVAVADEELQSGDSTTTTEVVPTTTLPIPDNAVMQLAFQFAADALWPNGTKIGVDDVRCTVEALRSTPGSVGVDAYDAVIDVRAGRADDLVEVYFDRFVADYRVLFDRLLQASAVETCSDVSTAFDDDAPSGWGSFRVEAWNAAQMILVPTASEENGDADTVGFDRLVLVPLGSSAIEVDLLRSGQVDIIIPDVSIETVEGLSDPNLGFEQFDLGRHEDMFLRSTGAFADPVFREAFWRSVDREVLVDEVYEPLLGATNVWNCGPVTLDDWCVD
ncbi:MAG: ABC transporter substrate-binding protein, partial [Ilumatobacteraceae bacterium]